MRSESKLVCHDNTPELLTAQLPRASLSTILTLLRSEYLLPSTDSDPTLASPTMCKKLIQIYACSHTKTICTTACPHAIETGRQVQIDSDNGLTRSDSTVSTLVTSSIHRGSAHSHSPTTTRLNIESRCLPQSILPNQPASPPKHPGSNTTLPANSTTSLDPAPLLNTFPSLAHTLSHPSPAKDAEIEPNFCPYYFPHNLPQSNHPCIECFVSPEWRDRVERWMKWYRNDHLLGKEVDVEKWSGVEELRRKARAGKLNVFVDGDESAGWVG